MKLQSLKKMQDKYIKELIFIQDIDEAKWF